jgi:hypothetical protein
LQKSIPELFFFQIVFLVLFLNSLFPSKRAEGTRRQQNKGQVFGPHLQFHRFKEIVPKVDISLAVNQSISKQSNSTLDLFKTC